jgi:hypothetical protein
VMQYPHWLMVAGGLLVILGFAGLAFRKSSPEPAEEDAAPEARPQLRPWLAKRPEESQEMRVDRPKAKGK